MSRRVIPGLESPDPVLEREIRGRLDEVEAALEKAVRADSDMLAETAQYLLAAGGKRFRPMLVLLSGYFGDPSDPRLVPGSVSIELVHQATLYHDDVIDEADARHAVPSANARWSNTVAILTGDYLFARASEISTDLGTDICALLARTIATLCDGQIREVEAAGRVEQSEARLPGDHPSQDRRADRHLVPAGRDAVRRARRGPRRARGVRRGPGDGLPALRRHHGRDARARSSGKEPGRTCGRASTRFPVLHALSEGDRREELARASCARDRPSGERLDRALEIVRARRAAWRAARAAVVGEVDRAHEPGRTASRTARPGRRSSQLAEFLAARCGARQTP